MTQMIKDYEVLERGVSLYKRVFEEIVATGSATVKMDDIRDHLSTEMLLNHIIANIRAQDQTLQPQVQNATENTNTTP